MEGENCISSNDDIDYSYYKRATCPKWLKTVACRVHEDQNDIPFSRVNSISSTNEDIDPAIDYERTTKCPKRLKDLACVMHADQNDSLYQFVVDNADPKNLQNSKKRKHINAVLSSKKFDVNVNELDDNGFSVLHLAVLKNNLFMVKKLLSFTYIDVNNKCSALGSHESTALHIAAKLGYLLIIRELLKKGADVDIQTCCGNTALWFACKSGNYDVVSLLLFEGAKVNRGGRREGFPLHQAAESGNLGIVSLLVKKGANLRALGHLDETVLHYAARSGNVELVKFFLSNGADLKASNQRGETPLHSAIQSGSLPVVKFLVDSGAEIDIHKWSSYKKCSFCHGDLEIVKFLLSRI